MKTIGKFLFRNIFLKTTFPVRFSYKIIKNRVKIRQFTISYDFPVTDEGLNVIFRVTYKKISFFSPKNPRESTAEI